jgi:hypothetical protein
MNEPLGNRIRGGWGITPRIIALLIALGWTFSNSPKSFRVKHSRLSVAEMLVFVLSVIVGSMVFSPLGVCSVGSVGLTFF